jgi:hypothetical protein
VEIVGTLCHVTIFHIFSILIKLNVTAYMGSNTLGQQPDLCKFDAIRKQKEGKAFSLASGCVPTCSINKEIFNKLLFKSWKNNWFTRQF